MNLAALMTRAARTRPDSMAVYQGDRPFATYREMGARVAALAGWLLGPGGLRPGDRVGFAMTNCPEFLEILYACWHAGLTAVPVNAKLHASDFTYIFGHSGARIAFTTLLMFVMGLVVLMTSFQRSSLGVAGIRGESMLVDLRDRILSQGRIPPLPDGWYAARELRSAGGTAFAGDFVVAACAEGRLGVAVVDVSGKGEGAGTRALLLSGALGGLIAAVPHDQFLPAANEFLIRQDWDEGFATAVHLSVDLTTGGFTVRTAGHPPAAYLSSGSGRWSVLESAGPLLGLIDGAEFEPVEGKLARGDALLLYTDGLVETPGRDIMLGIDRLLGQAERLLTGGMDGGAERLIETLGSRNDDRALLLVHRR
jgi:hypothetical protein